MIKLCWPVDKGAVSLPVHLTGRGRRGAKQAQLQGNAKEATTFTVAFSMDPGALDMLVQIVHAGETDAEVMPEESQVGASAAGAVVERSVWEVQSSAMSLMAYAESVQNTTFELGSTILALAVEYSRQVVNRFQRSVSDGKTAYERRKQKSYRKALVLLGELVIFMPIDKPQGQGLSPESLGYHVGPRGQIPLVLSSRRTLVQTKWGDYETVRLATTTLLDTSGPD